MVISILFCIIAILVAPLLLTMHRLQSNFQAVTIVSRSNYKDRARPEKPCQTTSISPKPAYCNMQLSKGERIHSLINLLTIEEKISLLGHDSPSIDREEVYLPAYKWWNEGLHGLAWTDCCPPHQWKNVTVFPQVIGLAMTWNRSLWNEVGGIIGSQAVQHRNTVGRLVPGLTYFTPNINIFRDPRWGRGQETPGEDPFLTSHYAAVMVMALQFGSDVFKSLELQSKGNPGLISSSAGQNLNKLVNKPRIAATCKHFAAYSLETNRFNFSADIDIRDWEDTYTPAFDACIHAEKFLHNHFGQQIDKNRGAGGLGVMCSYNAINGTPSCANHDLLSKKLRHEWNFKGYVVSDCWAIANIYEHHRFANSYQEAVGLALSAGVDLDCGDTVQKYGVRALEENFMDIEDVDRALGNLFGVLMDVGYFDEDSSQHRADSDELSHKHADDKVALEAALQSIVLLKNGLYDSSSNPVPGQSLPLSITDHKKVTVIGPLANNKKVLLANYHGTPSEVITPLNGLKNLGLEVDYIDGCKSKSVTDCDSGILAEKTIRERLSAENDATILFMGLDQTIESEEIDRTSLELPNSQQELISHAMHCSKASNPNAPVILVVISGGPIDLSKYKASHLIDAIIYTSYPGQDGGTALANLVYGKYNPSGRLVTTFYPNSYLDNVPLENMNTRPIESDKYPGRTYRFYNEAVYPFGFGLSYSKWHYSIELDMTNRTAHVEVSNKGPMDGSTSVLLFHKIPRSGTGGIPVKSLIGFDKVFLPAHDSQVIQFRFPENVFTEAGQHLLAVGPGMDYTLQVNI